MKALFILDEFAVLTTLGAIIYMIIFRKVIKVLPDGALSRRLEAGKYNVIVFGRISGETIRKMNVQIEVDSPQALDVKFPHFAITGVSNFRVFTNIARFSIIVPEELKIQVSNINTNDIKRSKLLIKRLLFDQNVKMVEIGVIKRINFIKFFLLIIIYIVLFLLLFLQR